MCCARKAGLFWTLLGLLAIALGNATSSLAKESISGKDITRNLDLYLQTQVREYAFSGSVLVVQSGQVLLSKGYGKANIEWDRPNTSVTTQLQPYLNSGRQAIGSMASESRMQTT